MKKLMFSMLTSAILASPAVAHDAQTKQAAEPEQTVKATDVKKILTDGTIVVSNGLNYDVWILAVSTTTSQQYGLSVPSTFPVTNTDHLTLPMGTYDIVVSSNYYADIYLSDDDDYESTSAYTDVFYGITINSYSTVITFNP